MNQKSLERISCFSDVPVLAMSFLLPLYCLDLGFSPLETTGLFATVSLALLVSKLLIGNLCDKIGRKKVFCAGLLMKAISYCLLAFSRNAVSLYIVQALSGVAISFVSVSMYAIMSDDRESSFAARRAKISSAGDKGQLIGVAICWGLLTVTTFSNGWKYLYLVSTTFALYATILAKNRLIETNAPNADNQQPLTKKLSMLFVANVLYSVATTMVTVILVLYLTVKFAVEIDYLALVMLVPTVIIAFISPALGRFIEKYKEKKSFLFGCIMAAIFLILLPFAPSLSIFAIVWTLYRLFDSIVSFAFGSIISLNAEEHLRGNISGTYLAGSNLGSFMGALIAGGTFQGIFPEIPFFLSGVGLIACFCLMSVVLKNEKL